MAIDKIPSFWDYLGQGLQQGFEGRREDQQRAMQNEYGRLGLLSQLYGQGALPAESLQGAFAQSHIPGINQLQIQPGKQEMVNKAIAGAPADLKQHYAFEGAGLNAPDVVRPTVRKTEAEATETEGKAKTAVAEGQGAEQSVQLRLGGEQTKLLDNAAHRYVSDVVQAGGGYIDPPKAAALTDQAFNKYLADRQASNAGTLPNLTEAKQYFGKAMQDLLLEQRKLDIEKLSAENRNAISPQDRLFGQLQVMQNNAIARATSLFTGLGDPAKGYLGRPMSEVPKMFQGPIKQYYDAMVAQQNIVDAMTTLVSPELAAYIRGEVPGQIPTPRINRDTTGTVTAPPFPKPTGNAPAAAPANPPVAARSSSSVRITTRGSGNVQPAPQTAVPDMEPGLYAQAKSRVQQIPAESRKQFLDSKLRAGQLSQRDYQKLTKDFGIQP